MTEADECRIVCASAAAQLRSRPPRSAPATMPMARPATSRSTPMPAVRPQVAREVERRLPDKAGAGEPVPTSSDGSRPRSSTSSSAGTMNGTSGPNVAATVRDARPNQACGSGRLPGRRSVRLDRWRRRLSIWFAAVLRRSYGRPVRPSRPRSLIACSTKRGSAQAFHIERLGGPGFSSLGLIGAGLQAVDKERIETRRLAEVEVVALVFSFREGQREIALLRGHLEEFSLC